MIIKYIFMGWCHIKERTIFNISSKLDCIIVYSYYSPFSVKLCIPAHCHGIYPPPMKRTPFPASSHSAVAVQLTYFGQWARANTTPAVSKWKLEMLLYGLAQPQLFCPVKILVHKGTGPSSWILWATEKGEDGVIAQKPD